MTSVRRPGFACSSTETLQHNARLYSGSRRKNRADACASTSDCLRCHLQETGVSLKVFCFQPPIFSCSETSSPCRQVITVCPLPADGEAIQYADGKFHVPDHPIIPFIEGDGTGRDIWKASQRVFDAAVEKAYGGKRSVKWFEIYAGEKAFREFKNWLPDDSVNAARDLRVSIKGPLTTPVGGGIRSLNVALRQILDFYACVRPVKYYAGVPSPVKHPEKLDVVIFRENTEDVYAGIEFKQGTADAKKRSSTF